MSKPTLTTATPHPVRRWWDIDYPVIAKITDSYDLIAHPNGPALCDSDMLMSIDTHPDDPREMIMLKMKAQTAWREYAWPLVKYHFFPVTEELLTAPQFAYSSDEENYSGKFDSREQAVAEAFASIENASAVWTGERIIPNRSVCAESVIDQVIESTCETAGDWAEGYLSRITAEEKNELQIGLQAVWDEWEKKHGKEPAWFNVEEIQKHERNSES